MGYTPPLLHFSLRFLAQIYLNPQIWVDGDENLDLNISRWNTLI